MPAVAHFALAENPLRLNRLFVMLAYGQSSKPTGSLRLPFGFLGFTSGSCGAKPLGACPLGVAGIRAFYKTTEAFIIY